MRAVLLAALLALGLCGGANAQLVHRIGFPPTYRAGLVLPQVAGSGLTGDCAKTPPAGLTMTACYDFANGSYTSDGVTPKASFTAAGGTLPAGCTVTAGTGLICTGTAAASAATGNPAAGDFVVTNAQTPSGALIYNSVLGTATNANTLLDRESVAGSRSLLVGGLSAVSVAATSGQSAICASSSTTGFASLAGGAGAAANSTTVPAANSNIYIGNASSGAGPNGATAGAYVSSVRLFTGTCNAANVQAASGS